MGCKVNQYESQAIREALINAGFKECLSKDIADIFIINTCTVTHHADRESRYLIGLFHRTNPKARIVVTGCYVEKDAGDISFLPGVSHIVKNTEKNRIVGLLEGQGPGGKGQDEKLVSITGFKGHTKAFLKIQDGCENACSYCKVPLVRSGLRSKPLRDIVEEAKQLVQNGFRELVLVGICLGAWGKDLFPEELVKGLGLGNLSLLDVLNALVKIDGDFRIRLSSIEPKYVTNELIEFISKNDRICRHLHIPLQSGNDDILRRMNRPYNRGEYKNLIGNIRNKIKDIAITTDLLVGFPGESDENFKNTVDFIKEILPERTHIFTFSKRKGTPASEMPDEVREDVIKKRYNELWAVSLSASYIYRQAFIGKRLNVLVETKRDKHSGLLTGYSDNYIKVMFEGPDELMKQIVPVKVADITLAQTIGVKIT